MELALSYDKGRDYTGLFFEDQSFSNIKISEEARRFAEGLRATGLKSGDIVATVLPNCKEVMTVYEGVLRCGGVLLPIIFALTEPEITYMLKDSGAKFIITSAGLLDKIDSTIRREAKVVVTGIEGRAGEASSITGRL